MYIQLFYTTTTMIVMCIAMYQPYMPYKYTQTTFIILALWDFTLDAQFST